MNDQAAILKDDQDAKAADSQPKITPESLKALNPIIISERSFKNVGASLYRVYSAPGEFNMVEADSAHEAFSKSGLDSVFKIERESFYHYSSIGEDMIEAKESAGFSRDTTLPSPEEVHSLLVAALSDLEDIPNRADSFEGLSLGDLQHGAVPKVDEPETVEQEPAAASPEPSPDPVEATAAAPVVEEPAPAEAAAPTESEPEAELSSDDVDALLNPEG